MPRGGRRVGAGRKAGGANRPRAEIRKERALKEIARITAEEMRAERLRKAAAAAAERLERKAERDAERAANNGERVERAAVTILPPLPNLPMPPDIEPLDFLRTLMRNDDLPLGFRRDCAALALPYAHAKPIIGLKDARRAAAFDDDGDDEIAAAMRS